MLEKLPLAEAFLPSLVTSVGLVSSPYPAQSCLFWVQVPQTGRSPEQRVFLRRQVRQAELMRRRFAYGPSWLVTKRMGLCWTGAAFADAVDGAL